MSTEIGRVEAFLAHYASPYYDPAKAREYYLRTRELKGRQSTKGMSETQQQGWAYTKNQIGEAQKAAVQTAMEARQAALTQLRETAQAKREEFSEKLRTMLESLKKNETEDVEKHFAAQKIKSAEIREAAALKIAALPPIPKGVSNEQRAQLAARRAQEIADINGSAWDELVSLAAKSKADHEAILVKADKTRKEAKTTATASRELVGTGLKAAIDKARTDYEARKEQIKAEYEATAQREYDGLRSNLPGEPVRAASGKSSKAKKADAKATARKPGVKSMTLKEAAEENVRRLGLRTS